MLRAHRPLQTGLVLMAITAGPAARADAIRNYAEARVNAYGEDLDSEVGPRSAYAEQSTSRKLTMTDPFYGQTFTGDRMNWGRARVSDDPARWLAVEARNDGPFSGSRYTIPTEPYVPASNAFSKASWTGDRLILEPGPGQSQPAPDSVRLNFSITSGYDFKAPHVWADRWNEAEQPGYLTVRVNDHAGYLDTGVPGGKYSWSQTVGLEDITARSLKPGELPLAFSEVTSQPVGGYIKGNKLIRTFHYDLPLTGGISDPLTLSLVARAEEGRGFGPNTPGTDDLGVLPYSLLSLDSITFADGSTPESLGYSLRFESGLRSPNPVPEPASIVVWGAAGGIACGLARRRRGRSRG